MDGDVRSSSDEISDSSVDNGTSQQANGHAVATQNGTPKKSRAEENGNAKTAPPQSDNSTPVAAQ